MPQHTTARAVAQHNTHTGCRAVSEVCQGLVAVAATVTWLHGCHRYMVARLHGCMAAWLHGCMAAWLHGCVGNCRIIVWRAKQISVRGIEASRWGPVMTLYRGNTSIQRCIQRTILRLYIESCHTEDPHRRLTLPQDHALALLFRQQTFCVYKTFQL